MYQGEVQLQRQLQLLGVYGHGVGLVAVVHLKAIQMPHGLHVRSQRLFGFLSFDGGVAGFFVLLSFGDALFRGHFPQLLRLWLEVNQFHVKVQGGAARDLRRGP